MPAIDKCHDQFVRAMQKDGWKVELQPYTIVVKGRRFYIDVRLRKNRNWIIVVEVKCFSGDELLELYIAIGQYLLYRSMLEQLGIQRPLYLAVPKTAYSGILKDIAMPLISSLRINLIVVDMKKEKVEEWLEW
jgi:hypothetical protein